MIEFIIRLVLLVAFLLFIRRLVNMGKKVEAVKAVERMGPIKYHAVNAVQNIESEDDPAADRVKAEIEKIYKIHENIGFPHLDREVQLYILASGDCGPITDLLPEGQSKWLPSPVFRKYFTVSREDLKEHLRSLGVVEKHKIENAHSPAADGTWIKKEGDKLIVFYQERSGTFWREIVSDDEEALDVLTDLHWVGMEN